MAVQIRKAVKQESKLRLALIGPSGSGKTLTSLLLASALAGEQGVIVIDTERGSASKYADQYSFDVIELESFSPESYIEAVRSVCLMAGW
jgi:ABC-type glutathione transport system ATPase component